MIFRQNYRATDILQLHSKTNQETGALLKLLLQQEVFPIKDSYVAYFRKDSTAIDRNPQTVARIESIIRAMNSNELIKELTRPIENNRQMGLLFKNWVKNTLSYRQTDNEYDFLTYNGDETLIFIGGDKLMKELASNHFGYTRTNKGLDFIARYKNKIVLGEAKFLTDFGGHQNAQFEDAIATLNSKLLPNPYGFEVKLIAILDGVLYIKQTKGKNKMSDNKLYKTISSLDDEIVVLSAIYLSSFLATL